MGFSDLISSGKSEAKREAGRARQEAKQEKERASDLAHTLKGIRGIVVGEADRLRAERRQFYEAVQNLQHDGPDTLGLVRALINEFKVLLDIKRGLVQDVARLNTIISELTVGRDNGANPKYQTETNDPKQDYANRILKYDNDIRRLAEDVSRLECEKSSIEEGKCNLEIQHEEEVQMLRYNGEVQRKELHSSLEEKHIADKRALQDRLQVTHDAEKRAIQGRLHEAHGAEKSRLQATHDAEMRALQDRLQAHGAEKSRLQATHDAEKGHLQKAHDAEKERLYSRISELEQDFESERKQLHAKISEMQQRHNSEKDRMRQEHDSIIGRMSQEHESNLAEEKARLRSKYAAETRHLRRDVEAFSGALLARDKFKPIPDNEIKARFVDLAQDVDALARLEWKPNQKEWTNQVLRGLSENQRLLKKQILQDSVWVILHEKIFCSPFRVFGEEGRSLESQWNREYGKDSEPDNGSYTWPEPSIEAERWRYGTIEGCRDALAKPASEWDARARPKRGFKTSLDALQKELTSALEEFSSLERSTVQAVESIVKKAAKMWLEFGMQRCRILVVVQGSNLKSAERIQRARRDTLKMVVMPELKRFGNSKGQDVHIEETVGDCDGEIVEVSMPQ